MEMGFSFIIKLIVIMAFILIILSIATGIIGKGEDIFNNILCFWC